MIEDSLLGHILVFLAMFIVFVIHGTGQDLFRG